MSRGTAGPSAPELAESRFQALARTAPDAIVTGDAAGAITYVNPAAERLFGHRAADMAGRDITMLIPERLRPAHRTGFHRFIRTGRGRMVGTTFEVTAIRADGREFPIELSLGSATEGPSVTLTAIIRDISDRRRRERHLAAQLAVTRVLAGRHSAAETPRRIVAELTRALGWDLGALWWLDADGRLRLRETWQADPDATGPLVEAGRALALLPGEGLPGESVAAGAPVWHDDLATLGARVPRGEVARRAGMRSAICLPLLTEGRALGVVECFTREELPVDDRLRDLLMTVASQVSEHVQRLEAQERLDEAQAHFRNAFEHAPIGMALVGTDGRWLDVNPSLCRLTGYRREQLLAMTFADVTHPDDLQADTELVRRMLAGELDRYQLEKRYVRADGGTVWVLLSVSIVRLPGAEHFISQIQDVTDARQAAELRERHAAELQRSNAELEEFAHVAAHDLRTPLRTISGFAELLEARHGEDVGAEGREFVSLIREGARSGERLLDHLLTYARAGASRPRMETLDAGRVVADVLTALRSEVQARGAEVAVGDLPSVVVADRVQLAQVFQNLLSNAVKFVPRGRRAAIAVSGRDEGEIVRFSVTDNGIGVAPEQADGLFEMFRRGAHGERYEGSGIGLAVCARIVARHGGRIWVEPAAGIGSTFSFCIPARGEAGPAER